MLVHECQVGQSYYRACDDQPRGRRGHRSTCFIVPMDDPHVHYQEMHGKQVWMQSSTGAIALDQVEVPDSALLGAEHEGFASWR